MFHTSLIAFILAIWASYAPGSQRSASAHRIAESISQAIEADSKSAPVYGSHIEDTAFMAFFAIRESSLVLSAVGDGGRSHGVWQMKGRCGQASVEEQAGCWLRLLHTAKDKCPDHPIAMMWGQCTGLVPYGHGKKPVEQLAAKREEIARRLLGDALAY
jgi:hypothetical protein